MKPVQLEELLRVAEYATQRDHIRPAMMAKKTRRRLQVGEHMTLHFEDRDTVFYQIQEMLRAEDITDPKAIAHELETYNELIPGPGELAATMMVEYPTLEERAENLPKLLGLDRHVWLAIGTQQRCQARFDQRQLDTDRISSVQFLRFPFSPAQVASFLDETELAPVLRVDHPHYPAEAVIAGSLLDELREDLKR